MSSEAADATHSHRLKLLENRAPGTLVIHEVYRSLQGEGTRAGLPCVFVRLTACQMRCVYCDTPHAFHSGSNRTIDSLLADVLAWDDPLVQITGGEPLLQSDVHSLMCRLADAGRTVILETGGGLDIRPVDPRVSIILDVKTPGSGESQANHWPNLDHLKPNDEVKFVVCDRPDFDWSLEMIRDHRLLDRVPVLISPNFGRLPSVELAQWVLESRLPLRMQLQLHKLLWGATRRGV